MPTIQFQSQTVECEVGENLRRVLMRARLPLYNGIAKTIHCRGLGTCGTCSVKVEGPVSGMTSVERWRLGFPPHRAGSGLRLACQCSVQGDLVLYKGSGLWGHHGMDTETTPESE